MGVVDVLTPAAVAALPAGEVSFSRYASPGSNADVSAQLLAFLSDAGRQGLRGIIPSGTYKINSTITITSYDVDILCAPGVVFDCSGCLSGSAFVLGAGDDFTVLPGLGANIATGDYQISLSSPPTMLAGDDIIVVWNDDNYSWLSGNPSILPNREYYKAGEFIHVESVSGSIIQNAQTCRGSYLTSENILIRKLSFRRVRWVGGHFIGPSTANLSFQAITVFNGRDLYMEGITSESCQNGAIGLRRCYNGTLRSIHVYQMSASDTYEYGINCIASYGINIVDPSIRADRHAVTFTGGSVTASIPNRDCWVVGGEVYGDEYALDMHGACDGCGFRGVTVFGGIQYGGKNPIVTDCKVWPNTTNANAAGAAVRSGELLDLNVTISDLLIKGSSRAVSTAHGIVYVGNPMLGGRLSIRNISADWPIPTSTFVRVVLGDSFSSDYSVDAAGLTYSDPSGASAMFLIIQSASSVGVCRSVNLVNFNMVAPILTVRSESTLINSVNNKKSPNRGISVSLLAHSSRQIVMVEGCSVQLSALVGIGVVGSGKSNADVIVCQNNIAMNCMQDVGSESSSSYRGSIMLRDAAAIHHRNSTIGDNQTTATQIRLYHISGAQRACDEGHMVFDQGGTLVVNRSNVDTYHAPSAALA